jgi:hypothetical protein
VSDISNRIPWIGLAHVRPIAGSSALGSDGKGAYANILALAESEQEYREIIASEMNDEGLYVVDFQDIATVEQYEIEGRIGEELADLISALTPEWPIQYKTFHRYFSDDA